jgi:uncharacterized membrane protein (DUF373 family)
MDEPQKEMQPMRGRVVQGLSFAEDVVYCGLGLLLAIYALALLFQGYVSMVHIATGRASGPHPFVEMLDQMLLILLIVELLYTVQVSFREHGLVVEPFLVIGLISVIRRILVLTAQFPELAQAQEDSFRHAVAELILLTLMIIVLVGSLILMQRQAKRMEKESDGRAPGKP